MIVFFTEILIIEVGILSEVHCYIEMRSYYLSSQAVTVFGSISGPCTEVNTCIFGQVS